MPKLPKYLLCSNSALSGTGLILSTEPPFYFGYVWLFQKNAEADDFINRHVNSANTTPFKKIAGYNIVVVISGSLSPSSMQGEGLDSIVEEMADFYVKDRVGEKPGYYKKFKTQT